VLRAAAFAGDVGFVQPMEKAAREYSEVSFQFV
jgi:hypothetical protein